jgi:pimeloyl-ACP methyl ester carboxylesterase
MTVELAHDQQGSGPLLVLVHGITENRHSWDPITAELAANHRVLRVDLRGHGESATADSYDVADLAADIAPLVDEVPLIVGHSLGGMVVTSYAAQFPTRGVVNIDQSLNLLPMQAGLLQQETLLRSEAFPMVINALFDSLRGEVDDAGWERLSQLRRYDPDVVLGIWGIMLESTPEELAAAVSAMTTGIESPYLALNGFDLGADYTDWLVGRIPNTTVETWDGVGHYPHLVRPAEFLARLATFETELSN